MSSQPFPGKSPYFKADDFTVSTTANISSSGAHLPYTSDQQACNGIKEQFNYIMTI